MKKLLLAAGVAVSVLLASCGGSTGTPKNFTDSLSQTLGQFNGVRLNEQYETLPVEEQKKYDKQEILRGIKDVLLADTGNVGYYTGLSIGLNMNSQLLSMEQSGVKLDRQSLLAALAKAFLADSVGDTKDIDEQYSAMMQKVQAQVAIEREKQQQAAAEAAAKAAAEAKEAQAKYIADLQAKDPEIKVTESGLAYKVVKQGTGANASADDKVQVIYTGTLTDGTQFDSSKGEVAEFVPAQTVPGFSEALQMMNAGSEYIIYIPSELGYGNRPVHNIPANSMLVFNVELKSITPAE